MNPARLGAEAFAILPEGKVITVYGSDLRGMIYGTLALVETLRNGTTLKDIKPAKQKPHLEFRGIKFNLPWETYRPSSALDQHIETVRDLKYWEAFLDMMVENRFKVVSLWNMHPFTFMVQTKNFPEASPWSKEEVVRWQELYRGIFRMAKERSLDSYIVHWSIFVSREFAEAHGVAKTNFYPHYYVPGDTSEIVRRYIRESVTQVLNEYPELIDRKVEIDVPSSWIADPHNSAQRPRRALFLMNTACLSLRRRLADCGNPRRDSPTSASACFVFSQ